MHIDFTNLAMYFECRIFVAPFACITLGKLASYGPIFHLSITPYSGTADIANIHLPPSPPQYTYTDHSHIHTYAQD